MQADAPDPELIAKYWNSSIASLNHVYFNPASL
jgi:hypothetical protein